MTMRRIVLAAAAATLLAAAALPGAALAASAYASDNISLFAGPNTFNPIVGMLQAGETVTIDRCTASGHWCRVFSSQPTGWVPASYLVGEAAKIDATPLESLTTPPIGDRTDLGHQRRNP